MMARSFFGGVHPDDKKSLSCDKAIERFEGPAQVVIPMSQHIGAPCKPLVAVGDRVLMGQMIGDNQGLCVPVHASVSGTVSAIEPRPHTGGAPVMAVVIDNDYQYELSPDIQPRDSIDDLSADELCQIIRNAGLAGMGGATFPVHVKISSGLGKCDTIIVNACECEPYITADDRLIQEYPEKVIGGLRVILRIFGLPKGIIAIEDNKSKAIEVLRGLVKDGGDIEIMVLKTRYPQGAEKQLIQTVTGREVPPGGLPAAVGCAVFNTASTAAVYDAVYEGMPLIRRVITVTGSAIAEPHNFLAPIGTPFQALIDACGGFKKDPYKILGGGPMMGIAQSDLSVPMIKGSNAITCFSEEDKVEVKNPHCIRCGRCAEHCPMHLMPLYLYNYERKGDAEGLIKYNVTDCIECGCCAFGCPARIHLVQAFKNGKQIVKDYQAKQKAAAEKAAAATA